MKWILLLLLSVSLVQAQGPDQEYIRIYHLIGQADAANASGNKSAAASQYRDAQAALKKLQAIYPQWNEDVVKFRLDYLANKLQSATPNLVKTNIVQTPPAETLDAANAEIRRLQADNAKLKESLSSHPNAAPASELAKAQEAIRALEKERDLLRVSLEQEQTEKAVAPGEVARESADELKTLRARLEVLEARRDPYTPEELALFKKPATSIVTADAPTPNAKPVKKTKELPAGSGPLVSQAERAFAARRFDEAKKKYLDVLRQDEDNVYILGNLAATEVEMNDVEEAEKHIKRALAQDPDDAFSLTLLGIVKFRQDKLDEALDALGRSAKINPENPETQNYLGITLSQKGQREAAEAALRKAIKVQPNYAGAHHNLAVIYATQKPPFLELARWHYEKARALGHPKNPDLEKLLSSEK